MNAKQFKEFMEMMSGRSSSKETNHVRIKCFFSTEDEDPIEWFDDFERAAEANNWNGDRRLQIASGYLKEAAADWYKEERINISYWKTGSEDEVERRKFAPPEKQHHWQLELNSLTQQEHERVDTYNTKVKRLLNRVNTNNGLPDAYIVRMFLDGLKGMNAALVAITAPKSLSDAVAAARRVEAGNYYSQHNLEQLKVKNELSDMKRIIDEMALNYAVLAHKLEKSRNEGQSLFQKKGPQCYKCGKIGHYIRDCMPKKKINEMSLNYADLTEKLNSNNNNRPMKERFPVERRGPQYISFDLNRIHNAGYIHSDFHSGNILRDKCISESIRSYISDLGLSKEKDINDSENCIYGVMPYIAPEVLSGPKFTPATDIC
ncbi:hypothetical protein C2G38_2153636 [Gigaspora rosea]|uniref:CCHC-type domain-containing protein n=1 Tax=Gigaspora rosea TaxID=44941 RepID=A0A397W5U0_9GLOM|nr:hypothetical protein C2G38_2153636 [Gigaspora rosea]